ncbi:MAG: radical SAM protein [Elusimicrobia bacterium]|nr:radical SAM protein [Elusimicrobiota bacterium]
MSGRDPHAEAVDGLGALLARQGWRLRRRADGFVVRRGAERRDLCVLAPENSVPLLTPGFKLSVAMRPGAALRPGEKAALEELRRALRFLLESLHRREGGSRAASVESHEGIEGRDFLLRTTFACNQRCPFCFVPAGRAIELPAIKAELKALARRHGTREALTISGGEPTVDPRLPAVLAAARRIGFRKFRVQTNAVLLARPGLLEKLVAAGARDYMVSLHSHRPGKYDRLTGSRGHYPKAVAGLSRLLAARGCDVTVNVVVNAGNYRDLPGLMDFLAGLRDRAPRGSRLTVHFSMLNEIGHERTPRWAVDLAAVAPYLREAVRRCLRRKLPISRIGGESAFPLCLLERPALHAVKRVFPQDRVRYAEDFSGEEGAIGRAKRPGCKACPYDLRCLGVPAAYARRFGLAALRPPAPK